MAREATDLRVIKTNRALSESFMGLLQEKDLDSITVNEICERAMVRRATFYKHFHDKQDLFLFLFRDVLHEISTRIREDQELSAANYFRDLHYLFLGYIEKNAPMLDPSKDSNAYLTAWKLLTDAIRDEYMVYFERSGRTQTEPAISLEITSQFLAGAMVQGIKWWLRHKEEVSREEMAEKIQDFTLSVLQGLGRYPEDI